MDQLNHRQPARKKRANRVTLRDVAAHAKVSTAVVSYVINNGPRPTSTEVRDRVLKAIAELDYHPNGFARGLRARRTHTIAFITNDFSPLDSFASHYMASMLIALTTELTHHGYYLLIYPTKVGEDLASVELLLRSGRLDGVILRLVQDPPVTDPLLELVTEAEMPCICLERPGASRFGVTTVTYDNVGGAYAATQYLINRGHRRIAHLHGDPRYATAQERVAGYGKALRDAGLAVDPALIRVANWEISAAIEATQQLMALPDPPSAIFAASDDMALGAIEALRAGGYRIPEDVAVIGFDGIRLSQEIIPRLTTVRIPFAELGRRAANLVMNGERGGAAIEVLPVELIHGNSA